MFWFLQREWLIVLAVFGIGSATELCAADQSTSGDAGVIERVKLDTQDESGRYVQAGFTPQGTIDNTMIDDGQGSKMYRSHRGPIHYGIANVHYGMVRFIRAHQMTRYRIQSHDEYVHAWFNYTRGYGPANWQFP